MKKLLILILICVLAIGLCACGIKTETYPDGQNKYLSGEFTIIKEVGGGGITCYYIYDNNTRIVYLYTLSSYRATMCPYYIIVNNEPTLAIYGVNYN